METRQSRSKNSPSVLQTKKKSIKSENIWCKNIDLMMDTNNNNTFASIHKESTIYNPAAPHEAECDKYNLIEFYGEDMEAADIDGDPLGRQERYFNLDDAPLRLRLRSKTDFNKNSNIMVVKDHQKLIFLVPDNYASSIEIKKIKLKSNSKYFDRSTSTPVAKPVVNENIFSNIPSASMKQTLTSQCQRYFESKDPIITNNKKYYKKRYYHQDKNYLRRDNIEIQPNDYSGPIRNKFNKKNYKNSYNPYRGNSNQGVTQYQYNQNQFGNHEHLTRCWNCNSHTHLRRACPQLHTHKFNVYYN